MTIAPRLLIVPLLLAAALAVPGPQRASACSCTAPPRDLRPSVHEAEAAFVGTVVDRTVDESSEYPQTVRYRFRVERAVKADLGKFVTIVTSEDGASCGWKAKVGDRMARFVHRTDDGEWASGLCSEVAPDRLLAALEPLPRPDGRGPPAFFVGTELGAKRIAALDAKGRVLAYGAGSGRTEHIDVCPGEAALAEVSVDDDGEPTVTVRDLPSLRVRRSTPLPTLRPIVFWQRGVTQVSCRDRLGDEVLLVTAKNGHDDGAQPIRVVRSRPDGALGDVWSGTAFDVVVDPVGARLTATLPVGTAAELQVIDLASGAVHSRSSLVGHPMLLSLHPGGRAVAVVLSDGEKAPQRLRLVPEKGNAVEVTLHGRDAVSELTWWGSNHIVVIRPPNLVVRHVDVYDEQLRRVAWWDGWAGGPTVVRGGRLYAPGTVESDSGLHMAQPRVGDRAYVRDLPFSTFGAMAAMPPLDPTDGALPGALVLVAAGALLVVIVGLARHVRMLSPKQQRS